jgi:hypothetical protein
MDEQIQQILNNPPVLKVITIQIGIAVLFTQLL